MSGRYIPVATRAALASQITCRHCGGPGPFQNDHWTPLALYGGNDPGNLQKLCVPCHKIKTAKDISMISKADAQRKAHLGLKKTKGRKLTGRGFDRTYRRRLDGTVEKRTQ